MADTENIDFWTCEDDDEEVLTFETVDDAVHAHLEVTSSRHWPEVLTVHAWARAELGTSDVDSTAAAALEMAIDGLNDEYGHGGYQPSERVKELAKQLAQAIVDEYEPWQCHRVPEANVTVNTLDWVKANRPDWLEGPGKR